MKCEMPDVFAVSCRDPDAMKSPTATLSASQGTRTTRNPLRKVSQRGNVHLLEGRAAVVEGLADDCRTEILPLKRLEVRDIER